MSNALAPRNARDIAANLTPQAMVLGFIIDRINRLSDPAAEDLASLIGCLMDCQDEETFCEIVKAMREILMPERVGTLADLEPGGIENEQIRKRAEHIGQTIRTLREQADLTQEALASKSGLPQSHISRLEAGHHSPSHKTLEKLASALAVPIDKLDPSY